MQPAFSNLFVQTEILRSRQAILCTRRPRSIGEQAAVDVPPDGGRAGPTIGEASYETDRMRFVGRGRTVAAPRGNERRRCAVRQPGIGARPDRRHPLHGRAGCRTNRRRSIWSPASAETRDACMALVEKYQDRRLADRVFDLAWTHSQVMLRQLNATEADAQLYGRLAGSVLYANASLRAEASVLIQNRRGQSGLWGYGISGDLPIVLLQISRCRPHRSGAPVGPSSRLLAPQGPGGGPGDLERGPRRLPPAPAGPDHGADCRRHRSQCDRPARRHLRALLRRADVRRGSHPVADRCARRPRRRAAIPWWNRSTDEALRKGAERD